MADGNMQRDPFTSTKLEEEREKADIISVRLNFEERRWLEALKMYHNTSADATALKSEAFRVYKQRQILEDFKRK